MRLKTLSKKDEKKEDKDGWDKTGFNQHVNHDPLILLRRSRLDASEVTLLCERASDGISNVPYPVEGCTLSTTAFLQRAHEVAVFPLLSRRYADMIKMPRPHLISNLMSPLGL